MKALRQSLILFLFTSVFASSAPADSCQSLFHRAFAIADIKARFLKKTSPQTLKNLGMGVDDIKQELVIASLKSIEKFDENLGTFESYIGFKMNWFIKDLIRRTKAKIKLVENDPEKTFDPEDYRERNEIPEERLIVKKLADRVLRGIKHRHFLLFFEGKTLEEIAETEGIQRSRARKSVNLAIQILRRAYEKEDPPRPVDTRSLEKF